MKIFSSPYLIQIKQSINIRVLPKTVCRCQLECFEQSEPVDFVSFTRTRPFADHKQSTNSRDLPNTLPLSVRVVWTIRASWIHFVHKNSYFCRSQTIDQHPRFAENIAVVSWSALKHPEQLISFRFVYKNSAFCRSQTIDQYPRFTEYIAVVS